MKEHDRAYREDLDNAQPYDPIYTKDGDRLIDADEALWLLKTEYGE